MGGSGFIQGAGEQQEGLTVRRDPLGTPGTPFPSSLEHSLLFEHQQWLRAMSVKHFGQGTANGQTQRKHRVPALGKAPQDVLGGIGLCPDRTGKTGSALAWAEPCSTGEKLNINSTTARGKSGAQEEPPPPCGH